MPEKDIPRLVYLEPYMHSVISGDDVLLYNSLNGNVLEYRGIPAISQIVCDCENPETGFLAEVSGNGLSEPLNSFLTQLRETFSGDFILSSDRAKPLIVRPKARIRNYMPTDEFYSFDFSDYLRNVYLWLNVDSTGQSSGYEHAMRQFPCLARETKACGEMSPEMFLGVCRQFESVSGINVELTGTDMTSFSMHEEIFKQLEKHNSVSTAHIPLPCQNPAVAEKIMKLPKGRVAFYITFPSGLDSLREILSSRGFSSKQRKFDLNFIIRSIEEYESVSSFINDAGLQKFFFLPYYDIENFEFFKHHVFLSRNDILQSAPDQKQVYSRSLINEQCFGKIHIFPSGDVFPNLNEDSTGNIREIPLDHLIRKMVISCRTWKLTRNQTEPCRDCLYRFLCPPVSNYEIFMNRYNFCDVL